MLIDLGTTPLCPPAPMPEAFNNQAHVCLVGAPDALSVCYADLVKVPTPAETYHRNTHNVQYQPVAFHEIADLARSIFSEEFDAAPISESYALAGLEKGSTDAYQQMYGKIVFPWNESAGVSVVLSSSHNYTLKTTLGLGLDAFICANGQLSADKGYMMGLKHTLNVLERMPDMVREMASRATKGARVLADRMDMWGNVPLSDDLFHAYVGILQGRGIITPTIANTARRYWIACQAGDLHDEHSTPNLANAFHSVTGGLQRVQPKGLFQAFGGVDAITQGVAQSGGSMEGIPAFVLDIEEY